MDITVTQQDQCVIATIKGRIDSYTAPQFSDMLRPIANSEIATIILDLQDVVYISSAGLRVLIDAHKIRKKINKGGLVLTSVPQRVYETLELAGFSSLFRFFPNVPAALEKI